MRITTKVYPQETHLSITPERNGVLHHGRKKGVISNERSQQSISRTKSIAIDYVKCNEFDYSFTLTFSPQKVTVSHQEDSIKSVIDWMKRLKQKNPALNWIIVPEVGASGKRLHLHGLLKGFPMEEMKLWKHRRGRRPAEFSSLQRQGYMVYTIPHLDKKYGYCFVTPLTTANITTANINGEESQIRWARYICKGLEDTSKVRPTGSRMIYTSQGLERPRIVEQSSISVGDEKKIAALASRAYYHRNSTTGGICGKTYIIE